MRVLVLHSDVPPDAPEEDLDTLIAAEAIAEALASRGHEAPLAAFVASDLRTLIAAEAPDVVFNLVEAVDGKGRFAYQAPQMLEALGVAYTGAHAASLIATGDKPGAKRRFREAGIPTPDWSEPPAWDGLSDGRWIVKSADEDASLGLDDEAVVEAAAVPARTKSCAARYGGRWFAERYVEGREFNVSVIEETSGPRILPIPEMTFQEWPEGRPRIVGYGAKWAEHSFDYTSTVRAFGVDEREPELAAALRDFSARAWALFGLRGTARVDFRVDEKGRAFALEVNPNPGIAPDAGLAAAAEHAGLSYADLIERVALAAVL